MPAPGGRDAPASKQVLASGGRPEKWQPWVESHGVSNSLTGNGAKLTLEDAASCE